MQSIYAVCEIIQGRVLGLTKGNVFFPDNTL